MDKAILGFLAVRGSSIRYVITFRGAGVKPKYYNSLQFI